MMSCQDNVNYIRLSFEVLPVTINLLLLTYFSVQSRKQATNLLRQKTALIFSDRLSSISHDVALLTGID